MKKTKIATIAACSALALFACDQGLSVSEKNEAPSAVGRWQNDMYYYDGVYDFYFRNGQNIHNDCDGYTSEPHGKTTVYEYWQSDIKKWSKLLSDVGIQHETYKTGKVGRYCTVTFDSDLLYGVGDERRGLIGSNQKETSGQFDIQIKEGYKYSFEEIHGAYFAPAHGKFYFDGIGYKKDQDIFNKEQVNCDYPKLLIECKYSLDKVENTLRKNGANVIGTKKVVGRFTDTLYVIVDATSVDWFAIGR